MDTVTLDFTGITSISELHDYFKAAFDLPENYGRDMQALWDQLHPRYKRPTTIVLKNLSAIPREMYDMVLAIWKLFYGLEDYNKNVTISALIELDFTGITSYWHMHEYLKAAFCLPYYYGRNMDALWDCLYCTYSSKDTIRVRNLSAIPDEMAPEVEILLEIFQRLVDMDGVNIEIIPDGLAEESGQ